MAMTSQPKLNFNGKATIAVHVTLLMNEKVS